MSNKELPDQHNRLGNVTTPVAGPANSSHPGIRPATCPTLANAWLMLTQPVSVNQGQTENNLGLTT